MKKYENAVRAALELRLQSTEFEVERMLGFYEGRYESVVGFFRSWLEERLAEQASWMLEYIDIEAVAEGALERRCVWTMPAGQSAPSEIYVFLFKPVS